MRHDVLEVANILNWRDVTKRGTENGTERKGKRNETENEMKVSKENKKYKFRRYNCLQKKRFEIKTKP